MASGSTGVSQRLLVSLSRHLADPPEGVVASLWPAPHACDCMPTCARASARAYTHACARGCAFASMHIRAPVYDLCVYACLHTCLCLCIRGCLCTCPYLCVCAHDHACAPVHVFAHDVCVAYAHAFLHRRLQQVYGRPQLYRPSLHRPSLHRP